MMTHARNICRPKFIGVFSHENNDSSRIEYVIERGAANLYFLLETYEGHSNTPISLWTYSIAVWIVLFIGRESIIQERKMTYLCLLLCYRVVINLLIKTVFSELILISYD